MGDAYFNLTARARKLGFDLEIEMLQDLSGARFTFRGQTDEPSFDSLDDAFRWLSGYERGMVRGKREGADEEHANGPRC